MVLSERNTSDVVRNGRRSRGPSPNTHTSGNTGIGGTNVHNAASGIGSGVGVGGNGNNVGNGGNNSTNTGANEKAITTAPGAGTPESSDDDNSTKRNGKTKAKQSEYEEKIRVGRDYQAVCPQLVPELERRPELMNERALLVWSPTKEIPDIKLEEYISVAKEKYGYNGEQALGMLFWHKHDLERAVMDLANFTPFPDEWTIEDKVLFEQAFQFHGKSFHRIRQMLPDKSIASLVKYYYSWKKTRHRSSAMDRQEKVVKAVVKDGSENGSEVGSNEESDNDDKRTNNNNSIMSNNNKSSSSGNNAGAKSHGSTGNNANNANNSNATGDNNNGGSSSSLNSVIAVGSSGSNNSNSNNNDLDDQLCIYTNALGDDMLGFGLSGFSLPIDNGADNDIENSHGNNGTASNNSNTQRVVVGGFCKNCNVVCYILLDSPLGRMCKSCHTHWRRSGNRRPISGPESITSTKRSTHNNAVAAAADRSKRKPPRGMYINHDDITALAGCKNPCEYLAEGDRKIAALMAEIQKNRQMMEQLEKECGDVHVDESKTSTNTETAAAAATAAQPRISGRWTPDEIQVALLAIRDYGKNFPTIAKVVGNKTEAHVRTFYLNNRRRFNLDHIIKEHEAMAFSKAEEPIAVEETSGDAATTASASTIAAANSTTAGTVHVAETKSTANDASDTNTTEPLAKKEEPAANINITVTTKKKADPTGAAVTGLKNSETSGSPTAAPLAALTAAGSGSSTVAATASPTKSTALSATTTITIVDESDTATSSSSDITNSNNTIQTIGTSTSSVSIISSSSSGSNSAPAKSSTNNNHNEADSEETSPLKLTPVTANKRESSELNTAELPPAKRVALATNAEFVAK